MKKEQGRAGKTCFLSFFLWFLIVQIEIFGQTTDRNLWIFKHSIGMFRPCVQWAMDGCDTPPPLGLFERRDMFSQAKLQRHIADFEA
jgi:hypothetical protein